MKVYCISGMGADHRVFRRLKVEGVEFVPLPWVPIKNEDDLSTYASRMAAQLPVDEVPVILGLSFGGMLATEIAKQRSVKLAIILSSAKTHSELPEPGKMARYIVRKRLIPPFLFAIPNRMIMTVHGVIKPWDKLSTVQATAVSGRFMQTAINLILDWRNTTLPHNYVHVHGTADIVIPARNVNATHWVKGGGHVMVYTKAGQISNILKDILQPFL